MKAKNAAILVVDDQPANLRVLLSFLKQQNFEVRMAESGKWALQVLDTYQPDIILLDVMMPEMDGFETCRRIKATEATASIPIIFITALDSVQDKVAGFEAGGVDYITKPFQQIEVLARVNTHVTLRKQEILLLEASKKQASLKRLESLKTMAGAIAHRFNNAMMTVEGNLELMIRTLPVDSDERAMASCAMQAAKGATQVGSMMLSYVGQKPLQPSQEVSIDMLVRRCVTALKHLFSSTISLKFIQPDQPLYCYMDQLQIKEVIESILTNAVDSLEEDSGTIEITFGTDYFKTASFPVAFQNDNLKDGTYSFCQIKDSGHGISPENLTQIFEPFYTTRFVGRGLGLALTVGIMQAHYGAVVVESSPGKGTTVKVLLPFIASTQQAVSFSDDVQHEIAKFSGNILFADDDELVLDVGSRMLEILGFTVYTAVNGREAVEKICNQNIDFCAAVLDISMPEMDGIVAMNKIKQLKSGLPILLSSGYAEDELSFNDYGEKPDGFLAKPFQLSDMRNSLEKLLS